MATNADPEEFMRALHGLEFPASRAQIVHKAEDKGGLDTEVLFILEHLPDRTYDSAPDLRAEVQRTYTATGGGLENAAPAAPSAISDADKGLISTMADPRRGDIDPQRKTP